MTGSSCSLPTPSRKAAEPWDSEPGITLPGSEQLSRHRAAGQPLALGCSDVMTGPEAYTAAQMEVTESILVTIYRCIYSWFPSKQIPLAIRLRDLGLGVGWIGTNTGLDVRKNIRCTIRGACLSAPCWSTLMAGPGRVQGALWAYASQ